MCLWKRERTYLFLPFVTTLVRQPHYAEGRCADKLEEYTAVLGNRASLDSVARTYNGVLPPNVETTLTLNADGTSRLKQISPNDTDGCEVLNGAFKVFDESVLMLEHPASGDNIFYKVKNDSSIIQKESFGNEPSAKNIKLYVLKKKV